MGWPGGRPLQVHSGTQPDLGEPRSPVLPDRTAGAQAGRAGMRALLSFRSKQGPGCLLKLHTKSQATEQKTKLFSAVTLLNLIFPMSSFAFSSRMKCIFVLCHKTLDFVKAIHFSMVICEVCAPHTGRRTGGRALGLRDSTLLSEERKIRGAPTQDCEEETHTSQAGQEGSGADGGAFTTQGNNTRNE